MAFKHMFAILAIIVVAVLPSIALATEYVVGDKQEQDIQIALMASKQMFVIIAIIVVVTVLPSVARN
ncbi:hypothetical protein QJS10_CPA08g00074 [Acorus calamus]|uniref:Uncharacterized protein n=1 Tax=Acorus calamus TaxID=4465 RepID=A0AAV9EDN7_ACOCL|nr:hypothetical protein QJS10_CPA08g00074 [Acorus calamus]